MTMLQQIRRLACVAAVGIAALGLASPAQASISLILEDLHNGVPIATTAPPSGTYVSASNTGSVGTPGAITLGNFTGVNVTIGVGPSGSSYLVTDTNITLNNTATSGVDQLLILVSITGQTSPTGPVSLKSSVGGSSLSTYTGISPTPTATDTGYATFSSTLTPTGPSGPSFSSPSSGSLFSYGVAPGVATPPTTDSSTTTGNASTTYNLTNTLSVFLGPGGQATITGTTLVTPVPVPEPSTLGMALSGGLLMFAVELGRRRRRR